MAVFFLTTLVIIYVGYAMTYACVTTNCVFIGPHKICAELKLFKTRFKLSFRLQFS